MKHRFTHLTTLSFLSNPHKPYAETPMRVPDEDLEPLSLLYNALCVSGAPAGDVAAERAVALLTEIDVALGFEPDAPKDVQELIADIEASDGDPDDDEDDEDDEEEDDEDDEEDEDPETEEALDLRMDFTELVAQLIRHGGDTTKVVAQAMQINESFHTIFVGDTE